MYLEEGRITGFISFGQYNFLGNGTVTLNNRGVPKGDIVVHWGAYNKETKKKDAYYIHEPNPDFSLPKRKARHENFVVIYSYGQLPLEKTAIPINMFKKKLRSRKYGKSTRYQVGSPDTFYYKIFSEDTAFRTKEVISTSFQHYKAIKGIKISGKQSKYLVNHKYLDENAPDLTPEQLEYIKARRL